MTPTPLDKIRLFSWQDHKSALWWLGLLYRNPKSFREAAEQLSKKKVMFAFFKLYLHFLLYLLIICVLSRILLFGILGLDIREELSGTTNILYFHIEHAVLGIVLGIVLGVGLGISEEIKGGSALGSASVAGGIFGGISFGSVYGGVIGGTGGIIIGSALGITFGITTIGITFGIFMGIAFGIIMGINEGIVLGIVFGIAWIVSLLRVYYHLFSLFLVWPTPAGKWYHYHPVAWDNLCVVPFPGLDRLLIAYTEYAGEAGKQEIERLISDYPAQRGAALRAKTILLARESGREKDLTRLSALAAQLPEGEKRFLKEIPQLREIAGEISALQMRLNTMDRPAFREPYTQLLCEKIENFRSQVGGFHEPLVSEFRKAAENWLKIAQRQLEQARAVTTKEPTPQVFRAGDPVNRQQEAFVPRYAVMGELEKQVMLSTGCPGLVVYARRRTGKSTLLGNLTGFIPNNIHPVFISMQNPQAFTSLEKWMENILESIAKALGGMGRLSSEPPKLAEFFDALNLINRHLEDNEKRLLIAIDEYENIDLKIGEKVFPEDLLATIRESIQSHRRITWIFAGSHEITELKNAPWTSYLVSARTLEVPMFTVEETRLLLTEPLKYSTLWEKDDPRRPRFAPEFWGEGGIERIHNEAGGWPHLVQLIAETIVDLMNDEDTREVNTALMERALDKAIISGHNVLYELVHRECLLPGEWEYLSAFRKSEFQPPPEDEAIHHSLRRRLLVEEENGEWRLRVPLMLRWLQKTEYPVQPMAALRDKTILLAREASREQDLTRLSALTAQLPEGEIGFLKEILKFREIVGEISTLQTRLNTIDRPAFRDSYAQLLCEKIENFQSQIGGFHEPLVNEFRKAAVNWLKIAQQQLEQVRAITAKEPTLQVFRAGDSVNRQEEAFVPRYAVMEELEKQIMLSTGCPGLMVYARRRTGKTTLLRNLNGFLPSSVLTVFNSMQEPQLFTSLQYWTRTIAQNLQTQIPGFKSSAKVPENLSGLFNYLSEWNSWLKKENKRILLEIDEYENIDLKIGEKVFSEGLLATIRESIQSHRRITWIFAGSHEISELKNAPWTSYLVSTRTWEVPMFSAEETRLLLTEPLEYSTLWEKDDPRRPRFAPEFWGEGGIERIHNEAGGWPHLVQLIAETIVDLMNNEDTRVVNAELIERALEKAIVSGHNVLYQLMHGECTLPGEWGYLSAFRKSEFQSPPEDEAIYRSLRRRLLVEEENREWRLRVPLMLRWLRERG